MLFFATRPEKPPNHCVFIANRQSFEKATAITMNECTKTGSIPPEIEKPTEQANEKKHSAIQHIQQMSTAIRKKILVARATFLLYCWCFKFKCHERLYGKFDRAKLYHTAVKSSGHPYSVTFAGDPRAKGNGHSVRPINMWTAPRYMILCEGSPPQMQKTLPKIEPRTLPWGGLRSGDLPYTNWTLMPQ